MKRYSILMGLIIILALIGVIGFKLSNDALAVMMGVGLGILASVPTTILLYYLLTKQTASDGTLPGHPSRPGLPQQQHPPVVIVNGGNQPGLQAGPPPTNYQMQVPNTRQFTIVGEESTE